MVSDYFKGASKRYFKDSNDKESKKNLVKDFKVSKRYKKRDMEIEIEEYEIKD